MVKATMEQNEISKALAANFDTILDTIHDDILISDGKGRVIRVSPAFEKVYGISKEIAIGHTVYQLEQQGYFRPSIIAKVIENRQKVTMRQKTNGNRDIVVTATPIFNEQQEIQFVVSFSRDITELLDLQKQYSRLENQIEQYKAELNELRKESFIAQGVVGKSSQLMSIMQTIHRVADFDANILLLGPSGVGKTMFARIVHQSSRRKEGPFIDINCAAIPENLLESELFGYEKGSFTGADRNGKLGLIELANGGTLLLDEISEMPLRLQAKLLKTIQDKVVVRVGGTKEIKVDFRLISASNRDLEAYAEQGNFRKDLFYRLNVVNIVIPPLKDRKEDIPPLCDFFLEKINEQYGIKKSMHPQAMEALIDYSWPGNVRELANVIERASVTSEGSTIQKNELALERDNHKEEIPAWGSDCSNLEEAVAAFEGNIIRQAYKQYRSSVEVGKALGISQPTAYRKIRKYVRDECK